MIVAVSDTHRESEHGLDGRALEAVREADVVCHAGDFTTPAVYEAFLADADRLEAVHGNSDDPALVEPLPRKRVFAFGGVTIVVVHGHRHAGTGLSLLARQEGADLLLSGHTHRPRVLVRENRVFLNPGSHDDPRGNRAAYAEIEVGDGEVAGRLIDANGDAFESFRANQEG